MTRLRLVPLLLLAACGGAVSESDDTAEDEANGRRIDWRAPIGKGPLDLAASATQVSPSAFTSHGSYLSLDLPFAPFDALRGQIERAAPSGSRLKNRGEAHVTIVTPPEASVLAKKVSVKEMETLARGLRLGPHDLDAKCVGVGALRDLQTVYVVVKPDALVALRRSIAQLFVSRGGSASAFDATAFHPHVTLGFTDRDLFEQDGVVKDVRTCPKPDGLVVR